MEMLGEFRVRVRYIYSIFLEFHQCFVIFLYRSCPLSLRKHKSQNCQSINAGPGSSIYVLSYSRSFSRRPRKRGHKASHLKNPVLFATSLRSLNQDRRIFVLNNPYTVLYCHKIDPQGTLWLYREHVFRNESCIACCFRLMNLKI